ncbi:MAG: hypothetical protein LKF52_08690 [Butyrivibrio sp.]|jgi:two-component SAPR family response regulator|nr:hypothetical protein [Butyrivibrio sp.]
MTYKTAKVENNRRKLQVRMLGGFSILYDGKEIVPGRNMTSKFTQLLQIVWLHGENGISREQLIDALYGEEDFANISNSFNNLIYQMRKQMVRAGLPASDYVQKKGRIYVPDPEITVEVDALQFRELFKQGLEAGSEETRYACNKKALDLYRGQLLSHISTESWVIIENVALQKDFDEIVNWTGRYLDARREYDAMYHVYEKAAGIYPENDYQIGQMQSLVSRGDYKEAFRLYDKVVNFYTQELGLPVSQKLMECYQSMSAQIDNAQSRINEIQSELVINRKEDDREDDGAYDCSYPSFMDAYHILSRNMERTGYSVYMMLCTLVDYEGKPIHNRDKLRNRSESLYEAIRQTLRQGDTFTRYSNSQYLILLVGTSQEDCDIIYRRISHKLKEIAGPRSEFRYSVVSLAELPQELIS